MHFLILIVLFALVYFGACLPVFQALSRKLKGRKFVVRLGTPWKAGDPDHRWDVLMSVVSFLIALAIAFYFLNLLVPLESGRMIT